MEKRLARMAYLKLMGLAWDHLYFKNPSKLNLQGVIVIWACLEENGLVDRILTLT